MQPEDFRKAVHKAVTDIAWCAWNRLGLYGAGPACSTSIDIEAALILAAYAGWIDGRLLDGAFSWFARYHSVTSSERLKHLLRDIGDPFATRCIGAMCESVAMGDDRGRWQALVRQLRVSLTRAGAASPPAPRKAAGWIAGDEAFKRWGLEHERAAITHKLKSHEEIVASNAPIRLRYLLGTTARADVVALLAASDRANRRAGGMTTRRFSDILGYHPSSLIRIQRDLEGGGFLRAASGDGGRNLPWRPTPILTRLFPKSRDSAVVNWRRILGAIIQALACCGEIEKTEDDTLRKHLLFEHQRELFEAVEASLVMRAPALPSGPLDRYSSDAIAQATISCLDEIAAELAR